MTKKAGWVLFFFILLSPLYSLRLSTPELTVNNSGLLKAWVSMEGVIPYSFISAIEDGIRLQFRYQLRFHRHIAFFLASDPLIAERDIVFSVYYDFIANTYTVINEFKDVKRMVDTLEEVWSIIQTCNDIALVSVASLKPERTYYLEARLQVRSVKMYPPFSFLSILSYDTDWYRSGDLKW